MELQLCYGRNNEILENRLLKVKDNISPKTLLRKMEETLGGVFTIADAKWVLANRDKKLTVKFRKIEKGPSTFWSISFI